MSHQHLNLLIIDSNQDNRETVKRLLAKQTKMDFSFTETSSGRHALEICGTQPLDCILVASHLADIDGYNFIGELIKKPKCEFLPVVMLTESGSQNLTLQSLYDGVYDYVPIKSLSTETLTQTISKTLEKSKIKSTTSSRLNFHDELTGLPNRVLFEHELERAIVRAKHLQRHLGLLLFNIDDFAKIKKDCGNQVADLFVQAIGQRLQFTMRKHDVLARLHDGNFALILEDLKSSENAHEVATKAMDALTPKFQLLNHIIDFKAKVGLAIYPLAADDSRQLLANAEQALAEVKQNQSQNFQFYTLDTQQKIQKQVLIKNSLRYALFNREFFLCYQPVFDLASDRITGVEAFLRWKHPDLGVLKPKHFLKLAEETGLILPIGEWVIRQACQQFKNWTDQGYSELNFSINISYRQLLQSDFCELIKKITKGCNVSPERLILEITETPLMEDSSRIKAVLADCRAAGFQVFIDNFGSGYASMLMLQDGAVDGVKIKETFIKESHTNDNHAKVIAALIELAGSLGLQVVVKGVETEPQLNFIRQFPAKAQGHYFTKPLSSSQMSTVLKRVRGSF